MLSNLVWRISVNQRRLLLVVGLFAVVWLVGRPALADTITNGDFETGTLAGWMVFTTSDGVTGMGLPDVVSFNTTGSGASDAAHFNVGEIYYNGFQQGGGLSQMFMAPASGLYTVTEHFASQSPYFENSGAGTFSMIIDGTTVATDDLGYIAAQQTLRGSFDKSIYLTAGSHTVEVEVTRIYLSVPNNTPEEYLDNISVISTIPSAVPEPSPIALLGSGVLGLVGLVRRKLTT